MVEDPSKPPIIAGESASYAINSILQYVKIDLFDWMINVDAMPKIGGKFVDWGSLGKSFNHCIIDNKIRDHFGIPPNKFDTITINRGITISDSYCWNVLIDNNLTPFLKDDPRGLDFAIEPMFHFNSRANAAFLKKIGLERGCNLHEGKYVNSSIDNTGNIKSLIFEDGSSIDGDWFFDCSGFAKLLLKGVMAVEYKDYSQYFPASSVLGWWDKEVVNKSYTELTALKYGWSWNINIKERSGNGYIYDGSEITLDQAIDEAQKRFGKKIEPVASFTYKPDLAKEFWKGNVIGIGISTGFAEPLESNGLDVACRVLFTLTSYWDPEETSPNTERTLFNKELLRSSENVMDFLNLHYRGNRTDSSYWLKLKEKNCSTDFVNNLLEIFKNGNLGHYESLYHTFPPGAFLTVAQGLELINLEKMQSKVARITSENISDYDTKVIPYKNTMQTRLLNSCYHINDWKKVFYK